MKWISTKERLPEEGQEVLFYDSRYEDIEFNQYYRGANGKYYFGATEAENISHWLLPAPPSKEEKAEEVWEEKAFKVGMKVRVVKNLFKGKWKCRDEDYPIGSLAKVNHISMHEYLEECREYGIREAEFVSAGYCDFHPDELEIIE